MRCNVLESSVYVTGSEVGVEECGVCLGVIGPVNSLISFLE